MPSSVTDEDPGSACKSIPVIHFPVALDKKRPRQASAGDFQNLRAIEHDKERENTGGNPASGHQNPE